MKKELKVCGWCEKIIKEGEPYLTQMDGMKDRMEIKICMGCYSYLRPALMDQQGEAARE